jgi:hypothetical protein
MRSGLILDSSTNTAVVTRWRSLTIASKCDSQDLTLHAVLSDGDNTVR